MVALAALLAFGLNYLALQNREATTSVAIADRQIAEGTAFSTDLARLVPMPSDFEGIRYLVAEADLRELEGWVVSRSVAEGELIDRAMLVAPGGGDGLRTMSVPVAIEHAAGATLVVGDRVDVISVIDAGPSFVALDLEIVAIADTTQEGLTGAGAYHIVVAVDAEEALALAGAIDNGSIEVIRSTGATPAPGDAG